MTEEQRRRDPGDPIRDGVRAITGILGALKDAIEETFDDLRQQGDLSPEKARDAARSTMRRAQDAVDDVRDRLDFVSRREFDTLRDEVAELRRRLDLVAPADPGTSPPPQPERARAEGGTGTGGHGDTDGSPPAGPGFPVDGA
jgi:polyhydroxyalkanoate synthesis regulator phasin